MILKWSNDGKKFDRKLIEEDKFTLDLDRDVAFVNRINALTGDVEEEKDEVFNFVGFVTNENDDVLAVFPKKYNVVNVESDLRMVFDCIIQHKQKRPTLYMGEDADETYKSNFPFSSFFGIYSYYASYGLYVEDLEIIKANAGGKVGWKETINRSNSFFDNGNLVLYPLYYRKKFLLNNFVTESMIYAIEYTLSKFGSLIQLESTGLDLPEYNYIDNKETVVAILSEIRNQVFKDIDIQLIDNLIDFYGSINKGGNYYLKHYSFSSIWEDIVLDYLKDLYAGLNVNSIILDKAHSKNINFKKVAFHPNKAKTAQFIDPDYYATDKDIQLIFDAKYKNEFKGMDYKQIAYYFLLKEYHDKGASIPKYKKTYSALIAPGEKRSTDIHFSMQDNFSFSDIDFVITEEYFDIKEVIKYYLDNK